MLEELSKFYEALGQANKQNFAGKFWNWGHTVKQFSQHDKSPIFFFLKITPPYPALINRQAARHRGIPHPPPPAGAERHARCTVYVCMYIRVECGIFFDRTEQGN